MAMPISPQRDPPGALSLSDRCVYFARGGAMRSYSKTADFFARVGKVPELSDGLVLACHRVTTSQDVHYPIWEMHPEGDELLLLTAGSVSVEFRDPAFAPAALRPLSAIVVPAGVWHRLVVHEPATLIAITPRRDTRHEQP